MLKTHETGNMMAWAERKVIGRNQEKENVSCGNIMMLDIS